MKVFLKRDVSTPSSRYGVADEKGNEKYRVCGRRSPAGETMLLKAGDRTAAKIRGLNLSYVASYSVTAGADFMRVVITPGAKIKVKFRCISFFIRGDVTAGSYEITDADRTTVAVVTSRLTKGCTEIDILEEKRELFN